MTQVVLRARLLAFLLLFAGVAAAQTVAPTPRSHQNFVDQSGNACAGCSLYSYIAGTTTPVATFTDYTGGTQNTNPIILDSAGGANIWLSTQSYKFILCEGPTVNCLTAGGTMQWTVDQVPGNTVGSIVLQPAQITASTTNYQILTSINGVSVWAAPQTTSTLQLARNFQSIAGAIANPMLATAPRVGNVCIAPADSFSSYHWTPYAMRWMGQTWGNAGPGWTNTAAYGSSSYSGNGVTSAVTGTWVGIDGNSGGSPVGPDLTASQSSTLASAIVWTFSPNPSFSSDNPYQQPANASYSAVSEVDLYWWGQSGGGSFTYTDAGGGPHTINTSGFTGLQVTPITGFTPSSVNTETVTVTVAGTTGVIIFGTNGIRGTVGFRLHDLAHSGSASSGWAAANAATMEAGWTALGCTTFVNFLGENDAAAGNTAAQFLAYTQTNVSRELVANPQADIIFVTAPDNGEGNASTLQAYKNALQPWAAANGYPLLDLFDMWGAYAGAGGTNALGYWLINNHPNPTGDKILADQVDSLLGYGLLSYGEAIPALTPSASWLPLNIWGTANLSNSLAATPMQCTTVNQFETGSAANGNANCGTPVNPTGTAFKNAVPDSSVKWGSAYWTLITPGDGFAAFSVANDVGYAKTNALAISSTYSAQAKWATSAQFSLICGQNYEFSGYIDATNATIANVSWSVQNTSRTTTYATLTETPGSKGWLSSAFTFSPSACTPGVGYLVELLAATNSATIAGGKSLYFSAPMLNIGSTPTAYTENVGDDDTGYLLPGAVTDSGVATFAAGAGAGSSPGALSCVTSCNSTSGRIELASVGTGPPTSGTVITITLPITRAVSLSCVCSPLIDENTGANGVFVDCGSSSLAAFKINLLGTALTAGHQYQSNYVCGGK